MLVRTDARTGKSEAGIFPDIVHEFGKRSDSERLIDSERNRLSRYGDHRCHFSGVIVRQFEDVWRNSDIVIGKKKRVAVGRCLHCGIHADRAAGPGAVLDESLLRENARQRPAALTRGKIECSAGSEWHDEANRSRRPSSLCGGWRNSAGQHEPGSTFHKTASFE